MSRIRTTRDYGILFKGAIVSLFALWMLYSAQRAPADEPAASKSPAQARENWLEKRVRIVDENAKGISGATVEPWAVRTTLGHGPWTIGGAGDSDPPVVTTDADGMAVIPFPEVVYKEDFIKAQKLTCRVFHPDYAATAYNDVPATIDTLDDVASITMRRGARIKLMGFEGERALPIERVRTLSSSRSHAIDRERKITADGWIELPRITAGLELLRLVYVPDDGPIMFSDVKELNLVDGAEHALRLQLKPGVRVEGRLDGPVERPVKNGRVIAEVVVGNKNNGGDAVEWRAKAKMRLDGSFVFESLPPGELQVIGLCDGAMAASGTPPAGVPNLDQSPLLRPQVFSISAEMNRIVLQMTPTADCLIHVRNLDGRPVAGATCAFWPNVHWWNSGSQIYCSPFSDTLDSLEGPRSVYAGWNREKLFSGITDENGDALVRNLPPNGRRFHVTHEDWQLPIKKANDRREAEVELSADERAEVTVTVEPKFK